MFIFDVFKTLWEFINELICVPLFVFTIFYVDVDCFIKAVSMLFMQLLPIDVH